MTDFQRMPLPVDRVAVAPDGSDVRPLLELDAGGLAHFQLGAGKVSKAVSHRTVEEIWFIVSGTGSMWRKQAAREEVVALAPGDCLTIPLGTRFQFRADEAGALCAIGATMPRWPGADEAIPENGPWLSTET